MRKDPPADPEDARRSGQFKARLAATVEQLPEQMDDRAKRRTDQGSPWSDANARRRSPRQFVGDAFDRLTRAIGMASMIAVSSMVGAAGR